MKISLIHKDLKLFLQRSYKASITQIDFQKEPCEDNFSSSIIQSSINDAATTPKYLLKSRLSDASKKAWDR